MSIPKTVRRCEIVSNLTDKEGNVLISPEKVEKVMQKKIACIKEYCYIIHDKDTYSEEEEKRNPEHKQGTLKAPHMHILLRFQDSQPQQFDSIGGWFGLGSNMVEKIHGSWEQAVAYQIHHNTPDKYQYDIEDVTANFDVSSAIKALSKKDSLAKILQDILNGKICEYNKTLEIDKLTLVYNARQINEAFKIRQEHLQATVQERDMECVYITGKSGSGKTTLAKMIAKAKGYAYFVSSSSNDILDGYAQQPCLIIDEARPSSMGLADLLKLLDPHTASSVKSRYKNKAIYCNMIIITSVLDLDTFYKNVFSENDEPITQLKRRCSVYIKMNRNYIYFSLWDDKKMAYTESQACLNTVLDGVVPDKEVSREDVKKYVHDIAPFLTQVKVERFKDGSTLTSPDMPDYIMPCSPEDDTENLLDETHDNESTGFRLTSVSDENYDQLMGKHTD